MEITAIKEQLSLATILQYYGLKPDKNTKMCCPFHEDKTPSMQVYYKTQTAYCFSSRCRTHGKSIDVIDFIMHKENLSKHEALKKAETLLGGNPALPVNGNIKTKVQNLELSQTQFLGNIFQYFRNAINNSKPAKDYLEKRSLDFTRLEVGYNSGQFHHGERKTEELIKQALETGLLLDKGQMNTRTGEKAFSPFGKWCICFALKNKEDEVTGLYFRSVLESKETRAKSQIAKHFYLKNRSGIYPGYPNPKTKKLILTEAIIDGASLLQINKIRNEYSLISCFGTNGLNEEILNSIKELENLEEIIFCFDQDEAGKMAVAKYTNLLVEQFTNVKITNVELPNNDVNETLQLHNEEIFLELIENRQEILRQENKNFSFQLKKENEEKSVESVSNTTENRHSSRDTTQTNDLKNPINFLLQKNLLPELNKLIEKSGIIGEENSRLLLFLITISYLNKSPLHGIVQGSSGSGKTHIISRIADLMPQEDVLRFTRITESSLYNWGEFDLFQKIIIIEDLDGLKEDALYALREFISNQVLRSSVTIKDKKGNNKSSHKIVKGQFSSLSATTKGEMYEDNMNRSFIVAINESEEQTEKIITYQNKRNAGEIDKNTQEKAIGFIQKIVRNLKHYEVVNPYATQIKLPNNVKNKRRLNEMFQSIIKQITLIHQYQRTETRTENQEPRLVTEIEDIENAVEILFESIILKIDELDGSLRQFFEKLKMSFKEESFTRFDAMEVTGFKKTQLQFYLNDLVRLEYLKQIGFANKGFRYKISYSDNIQKVRKDLKEAFGKQVEELKRHKITA